MNKALGVILFAVALSFAGCVTEERKVEKELVVRPSRTMNVHTGEEILIDHQARADSGEETFRFDPLKAAMAEMREYFFNAADGKLVPRFAHHPRTITEESISDESKWEVKAGGEADERIATWRDRQIRFDVHLRQFPAEEPSRGIWYVFKRYYEY
jgi:hypothetical protein